MPVRPIRSLLAAWSLLMLPIFALGDGQAPGVDWSDTSRDVYVDGELEPGVVVLATGAVDGAGPRLAVLSTRANRAFVVDRDSLEIAELSLAHFELTAAGATSPAVAEPLAVGRATRVRDQRSTHYLASVGGHTLLISPHQGPAGEIQLAELFETAPAWRRRASAYQPDPEAVAVLAAYREQVDVTVAFGTWCGDSRNYVPKLLSSLEAADNPRLRLELVAIGRGFDKPAEAILGQRLTNVPTVIVRQDGDEIGRIVETPAATSIEADLAAILRRSPEPHPGRWSREAEIARGRYLYRDVEDRRIGEERWRLFATEDDGRLLHSVVAGDERQLEIWHRRDAHGGSEFVELTRRAEGELSRTRIWIDDGELRAVTRGNVTGIVEQNLAVPPGTSFALPCAAEAGYDWLRRGQLATHVSFAPLWRDSTVAAFQLVADRSPTGKLVEVRTSTAGRETATTAHGEISALRLDAIVDGVTSRWWLDDEIGVAVRGRIDDQVRVTLEELEVVEDPESVAAVR